MGVWNAEKLYSVMQKLTRSGRNGDEHILMYVLNPYVTSMGYDVFDMEEVDMNITTGRMAISVAEDTKLIVGISGYLPSGEFDKLFLHVNMGESKIIFHLKALGEWEQIGSVSLSKEDVSGMYPTIMRLMSKDSLKGALLEKGDRMFTEGVLRTQLEQGKYDNRFVRDILKEEFQNPSDALLKLVADGLARKYSTDSVSTLMEGLMPLKGVGVLSLVSDLLYDKGRYAQEKDEPVVPKEDKQVFVIDKQTEPVDSEPENTYAPTYAPGGSSTTELGSEDTGGEEEGSLFSRAYVEKEDDTNIFSPPRISTYQPKKAENSFVEDSPTTTPPNIAPEQAKAQPLNDLNKILRQQKG